MARQQTRGRVARPQESANDDPVINLVIAAVKRAQSDLRLPTRIPGSTRSYPTEQEKQTAAEFLEGMYEVACRWTP